ncbi:MAG TPA: pseudouridine synthase [Roseiarcus sp.]|nr:pseudouridine synthase [Roseiarcus sp.]
MSDQSPTSAGARRGAQKPTSAKRHPGERIAKAMARAGLCSRRDAEAWIAAGRVAVNGQVLSSPAFNVTERDDIRVDGAPLARRERTRLFLFHKPRGLVTTARDPEGRPTIFDALPKGAPRLVAVGRLDINTEGLLLLTNDGGLARILELPATGWLRRYRVRAHGAVDQAALDRLAEGVTIDGVDYAGIEAKLDRAQGANVWLTLGLREGKNREIKRVLEHLGLIVNRLIRVSFGPFQLGELEEGALAELPTRVVREQIGPRLAREAGADFDAPLRERPAAEARGGTSSSRAPRERPGARRKGHPSADAGAGRREAAPPRDERKPERKRRYFAALRAERDEADRGPRKRLERGAISDRKGREIAVERFKQAERKESRARPPRGAPKRRFEPEPAQARFRSDGRRGSKSNGRGRGRRGPKRG